MQLKAFAHVHVSSNLVHHPAVRLNKKMYTCNERFKPISEYHRKSAHALCSIRMNLRILMTLQSLT